MKKGAVLLILCAVFMGCSRVPISGRKQLSLVAESELISMSNEHYQGFLAESEVVTSGDQAEMLQAVGLKLAKATELFVKKYNASSRINGFEWEFTLVRNDQLNAWCMPGGKICFYTGILDVTEDETGMAVVMGHEIAHAIARHGNERMSKGALVNAGGQALDVAVSQKNEAARSLLLNAYGIGTQVGVMLPFSRLHELEADKMGLVFMQLAGYDATKAVDFWKRMSAKGAGGPEFLSTHPSDESRISEIEKFLNSTDFKKYTLK